MRLGNRRADSVAAEGMTRLVDAPVEPDVDLAVAASVARAPTTEAAWGALERPKTAEAERLSAELRRLWLTVEKGRALVDGGKPVTPAVLARFTELHTQRLALRWKLEARVFPNLRGNVHRLAALADEECHAVRAATKIRAATFPSEDAQAGMHALNAAVASGNVTVVEEAAREAVRLACAEVYGTRDNTAQEAV